MPEFRTGAPAPPATPPEPASAPALDVARRAAALWRAVDAELSPIIGSRGVAALYRRAMFLTRTTRNWLPEAGNEQPLDERMAALEAALAPRSAEEASATSEALERTFNALLTSLIGVALAEQLLRSARASHPSGQAAQDDPS